MCPLIGTKIHGFLRLFAEHTTWALGIAFMSSIYQVSKIFCGLGSYLSYFFFYSLRSSGLINQPGIGTSKEPSLPFSIVSTTFPLPSHL